MALGAAQTTKFKIGTSEIRIGAMTSANKLKQADSIGLLDNVTVEVNQSSVDLKGGFPKVVLDSAIVEQDITITGNMREYSRRNMNALLGGDVGVAAPTDFVGTCSTDSTAAAVSIPLQAGEGTNYATGDLVVMYPEGRNEEVTMARVASVATDTLTLDAGTPTLFNYNGTTETIHVFLAHAVPLGEIDQNFYFAIQVVEGERSTGRPTMFNFWKATIAAGVNVQSNADDFAATDFAVKVIQPTATDYASGQPLNHLANIIPTNPTGLYFAGGDS